MQRSPFANTSRPSSCFSPSSPRPPMKRSPALFFVTHSPASYTLSIACVTSKPFRARPAGFQAVWLLKRLAVPLSSFGGAVLNSPQVKRPTRRASAVLRMPSPWRRPFLNSPRQSSLSSISSPQSFWSSRKRPSKALPLKQWRMPSSLRPSCIRPKKTQFLYFLRVQGRWTCSSCSWRRMRWQLPQQCMNCSCDHSGEGLSARQLPRFTRRSRKPSIFSFMLSSESQSDSLQALELSCRSTSQKCSQKRFRLSTITELCRWKCRTSVLKLRCSRETFRDWLRIHLLPWLLPRKRAPSCSERSEGPQRLKDFSFSLRPWWAGKRLALGTRSSLISTLLSFSLKSACLSAASLTKLLLKRLLPLSTPLLLELVRIQGNLGALLTVYSFLGGVLCCRSCWIFVVASWLGGCALRVFAMLGCF